MHVLRAEPGDEQRREQRFARRVRIADVLCFEANGDDRRGQFDAPSRSFSRRTRCSSRDVGSPSAISIAIGNTAARPRSCSNSSTKRAIASCRADSQLVICRVSRRAANSTASACSIRSGSSSRVLKAGGNSSHSYTSGAALVA